VAYWPGAVVANQMKKNNYIHRAHAWKITIMCRIHSVHFFP